MAYTRNLCKRTVLVQLIIKNVVTRFFETQCILTINYSILTINYYNILTLEVDRFMPWHRTFTNLVPDERTNGRTDN